MKHILTLLASAVLMLALGGVAIVPAFSTPSHHTSIIPLKSGKGRGVIKGIDTEKKVLDISHNNIPHVMMAMRMRYPVAKPKLMEGLQVGDSVTFTLSVRGTDYVVTKIAKIKPKH